ncbi:MAG TPA: biotin/lipoyl-containing protein, partial [Pirellula sp.]|nr:biotin/lipoyl-containing protein [Pirellula sp.]
MSTEIKLPSLGEGVESGDVLEIMVKIGDVIKKGQSIVELETDKATVSVPSPLAGKILSLAIKEGETIKIGTVLASIEAVAPAAPTSAPVASPAPPQPPAPVVPKVEQTPSNTAPISVKPAAPIVVPPI